MLIPALLGLVLLLDEVCERLLLRLHFVEALPLGFFDEATNLLFDGLGEAGTDEWESNQAL